MFDFCENITEIVHKWCLLNIIYIRGHLFRCPITPFYSPTFYIFPDKPIKHGWECYVLFTKLNSYVVDND